MASLRSLWTLAAPFALASCGSGGGFPDARVIDGPPAGGHFSLAWTLTDLSGSAATCDEVGGASVSIAYHDPSVSGGNAEAFTCGTGSGTSQVLPIGSYDMTIELVDTHGAPLVTLPPQTGVKITSGQTTALTPATFAVDATGNLKLHVTALQAGGNCAATGSGGAGITATTITLQHASDGSCAPVTFTIGAGSNQPAGSYTVDCTTPVVGPCIEADQSIEALGIQSGSYQVHVNAFSGAADCWTNNDSLVVPPSGHDLAETLNLGATHGSGC